jgi:hypothetical protein
MKKFKKGDIVLLQSPAYDVTDCKALIIEDDGAYEYTFKPLDGTVFNHSNFERHQQHYKCDGDKFKMWTPKVHFNEDLFNV